MQSTSTESTKVARGTLTFILITAFLNLAGIGIIAPVLNFIAAEYVSAADLAWVVSLLFAAYSLCQFIATPTLGALSDRFGRRPVLLISLFGSAVGYFLIGIGGALWILFLGRIIDGITGGNISTIYAYVADVTEPKERTRYFGLLGATAGMGFVVGPAVGGLAYRMTGDVSAPLFLAGIVTMLNVVWGYFAMPESLTADKRELDMPLAKLNPFTQLIGVFRIPHTRLLLAAIFLWTVSFAVLQSNVSYFGQDQFDWTPDNTNVLFFVIGIVGIFTQGFLVRRLVPLFGEGKLAIGGMLIMTAGLVLIALSSILNVSAMLLVSVMFTAMGNSLVIPSTTGLLSQSVSVREQGRIQGGGQSVQALARVAGPVWAGWTYTGMGAPATYLTSAVALLVGAGAAFFSLKQIADTRAMKAETTEVSAVD